MKRGLVIGKFMPLHRGHQFLIETALARCDDVTVVVYDSAVIPPFNVPVEERAGWVRALYPQLENVVPRRDPLAHLPQKARDSPEYGIVYARDLSFLGSFDEVITSEPGYANFAKWLIADHIVVDASRNLVPISGTAIRADLYEHRGWIDPLVYRSLIQKIVFVGTESAGKSTLARAMAHEYDTWWVHEFGRELWVAQGGGTFADHVKMGERQYAREEAAVRHSRRYLFCDTNAWTTLQWSYLSYGTADSRLEKLVNDTLHEYIWVVCKPDFGWVDDGIRELRNNHAEFHDTQITDLARRLEIAGLPDYFEVSGSLEQRVTEVTQILLEQAT